MPRLFIIAGCNGAGKTTASYTVLPEMLHCNEFVNADEIARGVSPFQPEKAAFEAGRIMLNRIQELMHRKVDFAFETTLASKTYTHTILQAKQSGYEVVLVFFWLESSELAKKRVRKRVSEGGHNIPDAVIERRYLRGLKNLFALFIPLCDYWMIVDNSSNQPEIAADARKGLEPVILNHEIWNKIKTHGTAS
ncbi:MAG: zeta toxin family protein [Chitinophagales bacterium]|nr:zeta toxin family protein [Chitinophagales bacterium]